MCQSHTLQLIKISFVFTLSIAHISINSMRFIKQPTLSKSNSFIKYNENPTLIIDSYSHQRDATAVKKIAAMHITKLASVPLRLFTEQENETFIEESVMKAFIDKDIINDIVLLDGKTIGFINYRVYFPWHRDILPLYVGPHAQICHLAIDKSYQKMGHGSMLLHHCLKECYVFLWTTGASQLEDYYQKFGFSISRRTKLNETEWSQRLQPHPIKIIAKSLIDEYCNKE
jgi:GNAT superfamily N-acetyltransferase